MKVHRLRRHCIATRGTWFPKNVQFLMLDDVVVSYYNSSADRETKIPDWLSHPEGLKFWKEISENLKFNRHVMNTAVNLINERLNGSHDHTYQAQGWCQLNPDNTTLASMGHAYDGKDFVSFDVKSQMWTAAVPEAVFYKLKRERDLEDLHRLTTHYESGCISWLKKLLQFSLKVLEKKAPQVKIVEGPTQDAFEMELTCHVTGFYPKEVQVEWLGPDNRPLVQGVSGDAVLPNGDGTYQLRRRVRVPEGAQNSEGYRCLVLHSSVRGNITVNWVPKRNLSIVFVTVGVVSLILAATAAVWCLLSR
ncbi:major histocompatibility complex class I-related gene protein-like [Chanos chanos]|uniref:Major histocompatibility complex class I-related gene protein-like n=1 Tax=Chanos chanos TaxID=29144 RepID=A0A6J2ULZ7_CHACN|nr:major histocompatibility complex class I-related gene protein-like [Chanos chanos]